MSDTKQAFTPGPWKANLYLGSAYAIDHVRPNGDLLGRVAVVDGLIETRANAHLIAAAPDMYEAGKEMAEAVALLPANDGRILGLIPILCRLRAAIAKVEGRS